MTVIPVDHAMCRDVLRALAGAGGAQRVMHSLGAMSWLTRAGTRHPAMAVRVPPGQKERLQARADAAGVTLSQLARARFAEPEDWMHGHWEAICEWAVVHRLPVQMVRDILAIGATHEYEPEDNRRPEMRVFDTAMQLAARMPGMSHDAAYHAARAWLLAMDFPPESVLAGRTIALCDA